MDSKRRKNIPKSQYLKDFYGTERDWSRRFYRLIILSVILHVLFVSGAVLLSMWLSHEDFNVIELSGGSMEFIPGPMDGPLGAPEQPLPPPETAPPPLSLNRRRNPNRNPSRNRR